MLHGQIGIAEIDGDHWNAGCFRRIDIGTAVSDHERPVAMAASAGNGFGQVAWIGLAIGKVSAPQMAAKRLASPIAVKRLTERVSNLFVHTASS